MNQKVSRPRGRRRRPVAALVRVLATGALLAFGWARADTGPAVIVDADMAADDARALALLLSSPDVQVLAVVTSDGVSPPDVGATNLCRLLRFLDIKGVPVGIGRALNLPSPPFRTNAVGLDWARLGEPAIPKHGFEPAARLIQRTLRAAPGPVLYVCLGPLTNLADALDENPELAAKIERVLWYGTPPSAVRTNWNARRDPVASAKIAASVLRVEAIYWPDDAAAPVFDQSLLDELSALGSPAARAVSALLDSGHGARLVRSRHLRLWDDLVALRLLGAWPAVVSPVKGRPLWQAVSPTDADAVREALLEALQVAPPRAAVVLADFPGNDPVLLQEDIRRLAPQIIARHGREEWKAAVLTTELHRHLGTYSIVGAKMGLRAREILSAGLDQVRVESHAGLTPPLSCVNDGLQVATGASLGRGTITVLTNAPACEALFHSGNRRLRLRLKAEFAERIAADLAELARRHGGTTPAYFQAVRQAALRHWLDFDRHRMFEETLESAPPTQ
ncbi:MAG: nucleoside hydrolase [Verrucomicrobiae bacterium]|nr:nucleoside hydrolase [Verrucomicrobiae bacterium]